ncbi:hypothetical protein [Streptomyces noursei]|uniref:hypothetical protein n=1 Tax=Streptomyces noursei TaxID=1971 RepID=UPI0016792E7A|nr:hypothetical protein [Streptomyces noursei]MCZ1015630.1 hypothetical protein [Streptomyces noursei]GGW89584.1 hypothetical protein GCM10010341_08030 [Streptomyces noursei]
MRDVYRVTFTGIDDEETEYAYEVECFEGRSTLVVAHTAWAAHRQQGLPEVDFMEPEVEFLGQIEEDVRGRLQR